MCIVLLSNIPHYHYLARAFYKAGLLQRYITSIALEEHETSPKRLPAYWRTKLEGRRLKGLGGSDTRQIRLPEILQRMLPKMRLLSNERADWLNNHLFDQAAALMVETCTVFHFVSSVGLYSARKAKSMGAQIVCDVRQEHPFFHKTILQEEAARRGIKAAVPTSSYENKVLSEFSLADLIITPSEHARRTFLSEGFDPKRVLVLPYGVDLEYFPSTRRPASKLFRIIYAGQITLRKGVLDLLEAYRRLRLPGSELLLVGSIDPAIVPLLQPYKGIYRHIPPVPKTELTRYYSESAVFVLPSLADSFSLATLEAMASGLPVIVSRNTGVSELIEDGREGFIVSVRDPETIAQKLQFLYDHQTARQEMGRLAERTARIQTWDKYEDEAIALYRRQSLA